MTPTKREVWSLHQAIQILLKLEKTNDLCLHPSSESEKWDLFNAAMEYLKHAEFVE